MQVVLRGNRAVPILENYLVNLELVSASEDTPEAGSTKKPEAPIRPVHSQQPLLSFLCGPESVWETLRLLAPHRIGHGTRSIEDERLLEHLRRHRIHLEVCPSSNVQIIPSIENMASHPIDRLLRAGVSLNVNTDTRMLILTTLTREYEELRRVFDWGQEEFLRTNLMGLDAAFVDSTVKQQLHGRLLEAYSHQIDIR